MNPAQNKIKSIVEEYQDVFREEYERFGKAMSDKRELQRDEFATTGGDALIQQFAHEVPLVLHEMFNDMLDKEEMAYYKSREGALWFARTFPQYSPVKNI